MKKSTDGFRQQRTQACSPNLHFFLGGVLVVHELRACRQHILDDKSEAALTLQLRRSYRIYCFSRRVLWRPPLSFSHLPSLPKTHRSSKAGLPQRPSWALRTPPWRSSSSSRPPFCAPAQCWGCCGFMASLSFFLPSRP